jgi:hypothetical protein
MTTTTETAPWTEFETVTCSRCGGSGTYSWTRDWGSTCFKCGTKPHVPGRGEHLSARGIAASRFVTETLSRPAGDLVAGDVFRYRDLNRSRFVRVTAVQAPRCPLTMEPDTDRVTLRFDGGSYTLACSSPLRVATTKERKNAVLDLALRYQALLTKAGAERKAKKAQAEIARIREQAAAILDAEQAAA